MLEHLKILTTKKDRINLFLLFFLLLFSTVIEMIGIGSIPIFAMIVIEPQRIIEYLPKFFDYDFIYKLDQKKLIVYSAIILFVIFLVKNLILASVNYFQAKIIKDLKSKNSNKLFLSYIYANYEYFLKKNPSELIRNVVYEVTKSVNYVWSLIMLVKEILITAIIFITLLIVDPQISLLIFSFLGVFSLAFVLATTKGMKRRGKICQEFIAKLIKTVNHSLGSIKETKILNKENYMLNRYKSDLNVIEHNTFIQNFIITLPRLFLEIIAIISIVTVSVLFVLLDRPFETFIPLLSLITVSAIRLIPSFNVISSSISALKFSSPSFRLVAKEISNVENISLYKEEDTKDSRREKNINFFKNSLEVKNLTYCYPGSSNKVIDRTSFKISCGDTVGVIGHSGAGKSTLIDIIIGLLDPLEGEILVDGINIKDSIKEWQKHIGYVPQEIYLLDDTLKANIAFGVSKEEFSEEDLYRSIKLAQLEKFIDSLPDKENTHIGHRGIRLSGGQRQRLGIARSLYFKPKILVLDEPTSALDVYNEEKNINDLYSLKGNLTTIIISHRYTLFEKCKKILRLENGKVNEIVNYNDLLKN